MPDACNCLLRRTLHPILHCACSWPPPGVQPNLCLHTHAVVDGARALLVQDTGGRAACVNAAESARQVGVPSHQRNAKDQEIMGVTLSRPIPTRLIEAMAASDMSAVRSSRSRQLAVAAGA